MNTSTLSAKGWVVIPQELRERYGLKKGDKVHFAKVVILPINYTLLPLMYLSG